jgi:hypothetical protein
MSVGAATPKIITFAETEPGMRVGTLGYVTATWSTLPGRYIVLTLRTKPHSPTGLERGVPNGDLTGNPGEQIMIGDYR